MDVPHGVRNWLHHLLLAMQAANPSVAIQSFARNHPLEIIGPDNRWTNYDEWYDYIVSRLGKLEVGALRIRLLLRPEIDFDAENAYEAHVHWQLTFEVDNLLPPTGPFDCRATLVQEEDRWVATYVECRPIRSP